MKGEIISKIADIMVRENGYTNIHDLPIFAEQICDELVEHLAREAIRVHKEKYYE
jgi:hypothetical protein